MGRAKGNDERTALSRRSAGSCLVAGGSASRSGALRRSGRQYSAQHERSRVRRVHPERARVRRFFAPTGRNMPARGRVKRVYPRTSPRVRRTRSMPALKGRNRTRWAFVPPFQGAFVDSQPGASLAAHAASLCPRLICSAPSGQCPSLHVNRRAPHRIPSRALPPDEPSEVDRERGRPAQDYVVSWGFSFSMCFSNSASVARPGSNSKPSRKSALSPCDRSTG